MTTGKADFHPLDFDEETGKWQWPPTYAKSRRPRPFTTTVAAMDDVLWTLAHKGPITDKTGHAVNKLQPLLANPDIPIGRFKQAVIDLDKLGLVEREQGPHQTYSIALAVPTDQVPGKDPHPPKKRKPPEVVPDQKIADTMGELLPRPAPPTEAFDVQRLAVALLDEVVKRATEEASPGWAADRNHIQKQLEKAEHRIHGLTKENEIAAGTIKALRSEAGESRRKIEGLEHNLRTALEAVKEMQEKAGITPSQDTTRKLARFMEEVPLMGKEGG